MSLTKRDRVAWLQACTEKVSPWKGLTQGIAALSYCRRRASYSLKDSKYPICRSKSLLRMTKGTIKADNTISNFLKELADEYRLANVALDLKHLWATQVHRRTETQNSDWVLLLHLNGTVLMMFGFYPYWNPPIVEHTRFRFVPARSNGTDTLPSSLSEFNSTGSTSPARIDQDFKKDFPFPGEDRIPDEFVEMRLTKVERSSYGLNLRIRMILR
ncbi:hypothetical protein O6P43_015454 [Quillaja saponaria]|uniref:Uncharacterized protein n=1 Tax=Quillaja saponaria TaxID=32244 RepID=A0AAD7LYU7_QUISA|nr:hypothetical protein O6P43_015454 [Quillaja saponaria]